EEARTLETKSAAQQFHHDDASNEIKLLGSENMTVYKRRMDLSRPLDLEQLPIQGKDNYSGIGSPSRRGSTFTEGFPLGQEDVVDAAARNNHGSSFASPIGGIASCGSCTGSPTGVSLWGSHDRDLQASSRAIFSTSCSPRLILTRSRGGKRDGSRGSLWRSSRPVVSWEDGGRYVKSATSSPSNRERPHEQPGIRTMTDRCTTAAECSFSPSKGKDQVVQEHFHLLQGDRDVVDPVERDVEFDQDERDEQKEPVVCKLINLKSKADVDELRNYLQQDQQERQVEEGRGGNMANVDSDDVIMTPVDRLKAEMAVQLRGVLIEASIPDRFVERPSITTIPDSGLGKVGADAGTSQPRREPSSFLSSPQTSRDKDSCHREDAAQGAVAASPVMYANAPVAVAGASSSNKWWSPWSLPFFSRSTSWWSHGEKSQMELEEQGRTPPTRTLVLDERASTSTSVPGESRPIAAECTALPLEEEGDIIVEEPGEEVLTMDYIERVAKQEQVDGKSVRIFLLLEYLPSGSVCNALAETALKLLPQLQASDSSSGGLLHQGPQDLQVHQDLHRGFLVEGVEQMQRESERLQREEKETLALVGASLATTIKARIKVSSVLGSTVEEREAAFMHRDYVIAKVRERLRPDGITSALQILRQHNLGISITRWNDYNTNRYLIDAVERDITRALSLMETMLTLFGPKLLFPTLVSPAAHSDANLGNMLLKRSKHLQPLMQLRW
ncbi:unnamed protein product, partial [Amoebophrya sp. A25]